MKGQHHRKDSDDSKGDDIQQLIRQSRDVRNSKQATGEQGAGRKKVTKSSNEFKRPKASRTKHNHRPQKVKMELKQDDQPKEKITSPIVDIQPSIEFVQEKPKGRKKFGRSKKSEQDTPQFSMDMNNDPFQSTGARVQHSPKHSQSHIHNAVVELKAEEELLEVDEEVQVETMNYESVDMGSRYSNVQKPIESSPKRLKVDQRRPERLEAKAMSQSATLNIPNQPGRYQSKQLKNPMSSTKLRAVKKRQINLNSASATVRKGHPIGVSSSHANLQIDKRKQFFKEKETISKPGQSPFSRSPSKPYDKPKKHVSKDPVRTDPRKRKQQFEMSPTMPQTKATVPTSQVVLRASSDKRFDDLSHSPPGQGPNTQRETPYHVFSPKEESLRKTSETSSRIQLLENKLALAQKKLEISNQEKMELMKREQMLSQQVDELNIIIHDIEQSNNNLNMEVEGLYQEKQYWQADIDDFKLRVIDLQNQLGLEQGKYKDASEQLQKHLDLDQSTLQQIKQSHEQLQKENYELTSKVEMQKNELMMKDNQALQVQSQMMEMKVITTQTERALDQQKAAYNELDKQFKQLVVSTPRHPQEPSRNLPSMLPQYPSSHDIITPEKVPQALQHQMPQIPQPQSQKPAYQQPEKYRSGSVGDALKWEPNEKPTQIQNHAQNKAAGILSGQFEVTQSKVNRDPRENYDEWLQGRKDKERILQQLVSKEAGMERELDGIQDEKSQQYLAKSGDLRCLREEIYSLKRVIQAQKGL